MSRRLSVAIFLLLCFTTEARAGPVPATLPAGENRASGQDEESVLLLITSKLSIGL